MKITGRGGLFAVLSALASAAAASSTTHAFTCNEPFMLPAEFEDAKGHHYVMCLSDPRWQRDRLVWYIQQTNGDFKALGAAVRDGAQSNNWIGETVPIVVPQHGENVRPAPVLLRIDHPTGTIVMTPLLHDATTDITWTIRPGGFPTGVLQVPTDCGPFLMPLQSGSKQLDPITGARRSQSCLIKMDFGKKHYAYMSWGYYRLKEGHPVGKAVLSGDTDDDASTDANDTARPNERLFFALGIVGPNEGTSIDLCDPAAGNLQRCQFSIVENRERRTYVLGSDAQTDIPRGRYVKRAPQDGNACSVKKKQDDACSVQKSQHEGACPVTKKHSENTRSAKTVHSESACPVKKERHESTRSATEEHSESPCSEKTRIVKSSTSTGSCSLKQEKPSTACPLKRKHNAHQSVSCSTKKQSSKANDPEREELESKIRNLEARLNRLLHNRAIDTSEAQQLIGPTDSRVKEAHRHSLRNGNGQDHVHIPEARHVSEYQGPSKRQSSSEKSTSKHRSSNECESPSEQQNLSGSCKTDPSDESNKVIDRLRNLIAQLDRTELLAAEVANRLTALEAWLERKEAAIESADPVYVTVTQPDVFRRAIQTVARGIHDSIQRHKHVDLGPPPNDYQGMNASNTNANANTNASLNPNTNARAAGSNAALAYNIGPQLQPAPASAQVQVSQGSLDPLLATPTIHHSVFTTTPTATSIYDPLAGEDAYIRSQVLQYI